MRFVVYGLSESILRIGLKICLLGEDVTLSETKKLLRKRPQGWWIRDPPDVRMTLPWGRFVWGMIIACSLKDAADGKIIVHHSPESLFASFEMT